jgi:N-acetylmuramoyl-L-alanine amidase
MKSVKERNKDMKSLRLTLAALVTASLAVTGGLYSASAQTPVSPALLAQSSTFGVIETDQNPFVLVAQPTSNLGGVQRYGLMIIEQKRPSPLCWSESGSNPTQIEVLLLNFDFTGICGKATDTNGYLVRAGGEDLRYDPVMEARDGRLFLMGQPRRSLSGAVQGPPIVIGQTDGIASNGFTKIFLSPGWRLSRQTYNGSPTGRLYINNDLTLAQLTSGSPSPTPTPTPSPTPTPTPPPTASYPFPDIAGDIYANQIALAVNYGFIAGFPDGRFGPREPVTREQFASMLAEALISRLPSTVNSQQLPTVTAPPFPDVAANRWSAAKIQLLKNAGILKGDPSGRFRPTDNVTRAEVIAAMRQLIQSVSVPTPQSEQTAFEFTDISDHWAREAILIMSANCNVATPLNETGTAFAPNQLALRNYTATAIVRFLDCGVTPR